jgi:hypothetical protein
MAWQDVMVIMLRAMVDDLDDTSRKFTDDRLEQTLAVGAFQVLRELTFSTSYVVDVVKIKITPDPTDSVNGTNDESFVNLATLKAACIIDRGAASTAAGQAIAVKDGTSAIDLRGILDGRMKLLAKGGYCSVYKETKTEYQVNQSTSAGAAVMSPFRLYANQCGYQPFSRDIYDVRTFDAIRY